MLGLFLLSNGRAALFLVALIDLTSAMSRSSDDFARSCYETKLPEYAESSATRTAPWGSPGIQVGPQACCTSLEEIRAGIDAVDEDLLQLLSKRFRSSFLRF
jgi:hypothetical protein